MRIVITKPDFFEGEAERITHLLRSGRADYLHIRKPQSPREEMERLILQIPSDLRPRLTLHDHYELAQKFCLGGIHLNSRNPQPPANWKGRLSRSCHTLHEVKEWKKSCDYVTLSPIFDSISKKGYTAVFSRKQLLAAKTEGIIDKQVIALGGVTEDRLEDIRELGFGGSAMLGAAWPTLAKVLTIAGSDPSGGAGIQADIKVITNLGGYAAAAMTALTIQSTLGVQGIFPVPADVVAQQIAVVMEDIELQSIKIGMVGSAEVVHVIAEALRKYRPQHVVFDPVMVSTSGHSLIAEGALPTIERELLPLVTLITPNLSEAQSLWRKPIDSIEIMEQAAADLAQRYGISVLIKGGHLNGDQMCDILYHQSQFHHFTAPRIETKNLHGTGCTLSSAIATELAKGQPMQNAVATAKAYVTRGIEGGRDLCVGHGNGPLWYNVNNNDI